ncbi:uncharacterized protein NECHADRAFT_43895 [Fusarium vanettenii 77-13-4]|uniref:Uncharacterized protein n=1 Tax=Fusarium vanettenii (strain ATCC MYA-4622 / CBS 123669 / FGSC 9596 / NRRL 45880 / 77-13-4) TaxID=660122 RepID=C7Z8F8_FUSV7|nr:uncharacterized protein NECHADRAFT_43895 [Fusarium vanettenii 77-13-4]EEU38928.1 hypothetical protein NECHADRAFT_43895 [Fusarium vanettenii 77-13-4]
MSQPILSIKSDDNKSKAIANLLPCRIHHDGPIPDVSNYWSPTTAEAYFRGRKLHGKTVKLPEQCRGVLVERRQEKEQQPAVEEPVVVIDDDEAEKGPAGTMQVTAEFDEMVIWGHETLVDAAEDPYIRSMEEWLQVAGQVSSFPPRHASFSC